MDYRAPALLFCLFAVGTLSACKSDETPDQASGPGPNGSYLFVTSDNFYFGTTPVGTTRTQRVEIANRGADAYPINKFEVIGDNREEFKTVLPEPLVLQPAEVIRLEVAFQPVTDGRKYADINIEFDVIDLAPEADNKKELAFYDAKDFETRQDYQSATKKYAQYLATEPSVAINKRRASIKLPVVRESATHGDGGDFKTYLAALNAREQGDLERALFEADQVIVANADSYVADDALYLRGYIQLMDQKNYLQAQKTMQQLRRDYPESNYYDTALYSEALALQALGRHDTAAEILQDLRYKHTAFTAFGIALPKDSVISRLWFDRANDALAEFKAQ